MISAARLAPIEARGQLRSRKTGSAAASLSSTRHVSGARCLGVIGRSAHACSAQFLARRSCRKSSGSVTTAILAPWDGDEEEAASQEDLRAQAQNRLANIMRGSGSLKDEAISNIFNEIPDDADKLCVYMMMCSGLGGLSILLTLINNTDPFGGVDGDMASLKALGIGIAGVLPLILMHVATWAPAVRSRFPELDQVLEKDRDVSFPLIEGFSFPQLAAYTVSGSIPACMLVHTVVQGGLTQSFRYYSALLDFEAPGVAIAVGCLGAAGFCAVVNSSLGHGAMAANASWRQRMVLEEAIENADHFYSVQGSSELAAEKAVVFKEQAEAHLRAEELLVTVGPARAAAEALFFSLLYSGTGNMAAPLAAIITYHLVYGYHVRFHGKV